MTLLVFLFLAHVYDYGDFFLIKSLHLTTYLTWIVLSVREKLFFPYKKTFLVYLASSREYKQFIFSLCYSWGGGGGHVLCHKEWLTIPRKYFFLLKQRVRLKLITSFNLKMSTSPAIFIMLTEPVQPGQAIGKIKKIFKTANCMTFFCLCFQKFSSLESEEKQQ